MLETSKKYRAKLSEARHIKSLGEFNHNMRMEKDCLGTMEIPVHAYYGIQSRRAQENFPLSGQKTHSKLIWAMGLVKYACTEANIRTGSMPLDIGNAIKIACQEFTNGLYDDEVLVESIQGGAGTSINMNVNEILANRALEILGEPKGFYERVSPNTHANMAQSTNDVVPTAFKVAVLMMKDDLLKNLEHLVSALKDKSHDFDEIVTIGRTHLQDAIPIRLGQAFESYARLIQRDINRINMALEDFYYVNLGATAVGTGLNADPQYIQAAIEELGKATGMDIKLAEHLMDSTQNTDCYVHLSGALRTCALNLSKMANDLRLMASGPICGLMEIKLPAVQPGSSIMPGKVNPVMVEMMNQICFQIQGNDHAVAMASEAGQFQLNVMAPVIFKNLFESIEILSNGVKVLRERCIEGIVANKEVCNERVNNSIGLVTALNPHIGYEKSSEIAKEVLESKKSVREVVLSKGVLTEEQLDIILNPKEMTEPGIAGSQLLNL